MSPSAGSDPRIAALAEALHRAVPGYGRWMAYGRGTESSHEWQSRADAMTSEATVHAAAILAALPPGWCGHIGVEEAIAQGQSRIAVLDARIVDLNGEVLALMTDLARLRRIEEAARDYTVAVDADLYREGTPEDWWEREATLAALRAALEEKP